MVQLTPGTNILASGRELSDTIEYRYLVAGRGAGDAVRELGVGRVETQVTTHDGKPALRLVRSFDGGSTRFRDTAIVALDGLAPLVESHRSGERQTRFSYDGARVHRAVVAPDSARSDGVESYDVPVFHFNELDAIVRALPLRRGYEAIVPLYSQGDNALERDTLRVLAPDSIGVWSVRFADRVIAATYGIDGVTRRIVRYDVVSQKGDRHGRWRITRP